MLKLLLQVILAIMAVAAVNGTGCTLQYKGNMKHPDLPNHCQYPEHKLNIAVNETLYPTNLAKSCIKVLCREDYVLEIRHCDHPDIDKCQLSEYDYTRPFPDCCPIMTCNNKEYRTEDI